MSAITVEHNVLADALSALGGRDGWQICLGGADCRVGYFRDADVVLLEQMRVTPFHKARGPERTVCFCFGHSEGDIRDDVRRNGRSTIRESIADACRHGRDDCERSNPEGRCCLGNVARMIETAPHAEPTTISTLKGWAADGAPFCVFTCYDATSARWLARGGARVLLVGDSAAQCVLGLASSERAPFQFMATIGAAVKRGAPDALVIVDYPDDLAASPAEHAGHVRRLADESGAEAVKVEGTAEQLRSLLAASDAAAVAIVAHLHVGDVRPARCCCARSAPAERPQGLDAAALVADALAIADAGAVALLFDGLTGADGAEVARTLRQKRSDLPLIGCSAGRSFPGQVEMLHDLLGLNEDSRSALAIGAAIEQAARDRIAALTLPSSSVSR